MNEYEPRFGFVDGYLGHLDRIIAEIQDPFLQGQYLGFITTTAVTCYELAIKDVFYCFSDKKHAVLGAFTRSHFERLNGRIKVRDLKEQHVAAYGQKYKVRFTRNLAIIEKSYLKDFHLSPATCFDNIITWRHQFVHGGNQPTTTNYAELKRHYEAGKQIIKCLAQTMTR